MLHLTGLGKSFAQAECLAGRSIDAASRLTLTSGFDAHTVQLRGSHPMGGLEVVLTRLRGSRPKAALKLTRLNFATHASLSGGLEVVFTRRRGSRHQAALTLTREHDCNTRCYFLVSGQEPPRALLKGREEGAYQGQPHGLLLPQRSVR